MYGLVTVIHATTNRTALEEGVMTLSLSHLEQTAKLLSECIEMAKDAIEGEEKLTDTEDSQRKLRELLEPQKQQPQEAQTNSGKDDKQENNASKSKGSSKGRVGQRNPTRDPVGSESL